MKRTGFTIYMDISEQIICMKRMKVVCRKFNSAQDTIELGSDVSDLPMFLLPIQRQLKLNHTTKETFHSDLE